MHCLERGVYIIYVGKGLWLLSALVQKVVCMAQTR